MKENKNDPIEEPAKALLPVEQEEQGGSLSDCFKFASAAEKFMVLTGIILALLNGSARSVFCLVISLSVSSFDVRYTRAEFEAKILGNALNYVYIAIIMFVGIIGSRTLLRINAQRQGYKFRRAYLKALFQHDVTYFEKKNPMEISSQVEKDCKTISDSLDLHLELLFTMAGTLIGALVVSFIRSWHFALMMFVTAPFILLSMGTFHKTIMKSNATRSEKYAQAGAIAEEALTNIKTVASLGGEKAELKRYTEAIESAKKDLFKNGVFQGLAFGSIELIFMLSMAIINFIGSYFIEYGTINPSTGNFYILADIFTPLYSLIQAISVIPVLAGAMQGITGAKTKARKILNAVEQVQVSESTLSKIPNFKGAIAFKNVSFAYPANKDKTILNNLNLQIEPNTKVALVGESGSGKTTIIQILQKFYEPNSGSIEFDGKDLRTLDVSWLRKNLAYVGQEPVLFSMTIRENLLLAKGDATENEIIEALKKANAYDFVMGMEKKLDTIIGGGASSQLSGGQKQRIAIARALLKDARVLILDEATSALDRISEKEIQDTLDHLPGQRTVIIVAHRLSTIKEADKIIVLNQGQVEESGKHADLMNKGGQYYKLQAIQAELSSPTKAKATETQMNKILEKEEEKLGGYDYGDEEGLPLITKEQVRSRKEDAKIVSENKGLSFSDIKRLWNLAKTEKKFFIFGVCGSVGHSFVNPVSNLLIALLSGVLLRSTDPDFRETVNLLCLLFAIVGFIIFGVFVLEFTFFSRASESLIQILRREVFYKFLRMHSGWHDLPKNKPANLVASLEKDTTDAGQITGTSLGIIIQIILSCFVTIVTALFVAWQLALVGAVVAPLLLFVVFKMNTNESRGEEKGASLLTRTEVLVSEAINNMKTIISLDAQETFLEEYSGIIMEYQRVKVRTKLINCLIEGCLFLFLYTDFALMYYLGTYLYLNEGLEPARIFFAVFGVTFSALGATQLFYLIPDTGKAVHSVHQMFRCLDMQSKIDIEHKSKVYRGKIEGNIEFRNVSFSYPTRSGEVFNNLNFKLDAGRHIGLTGPSGCGKSTIIQLLLRLYDTDKGDILIEGVNIKDYDLTYLRRKIGVVSQEPVLFYGSIEYNLKYANEEITDTEMKEATRRANATRFIESGVEEDQRVENYKPSNEGYARLVGSKGAQLSGGQKQRIAIARAILRKPAILLLDEATSALDAESESLVQKALTQVSEGLTTISVAHRFSTLQDLDEILVLKDGRIIERGNFNQLVEKKGYFHQLKEGARE